MTLLARTAGVTLLGLALAACGGGSGGDEGAIEELFRDFFAAFADGDAPALAGLMSDDCEDVENTAVEAIGAFQRRLSGDVDFDVTGVDIRELTEDTAEALPEGTVSFDGAESPLAREGDAYATLVKVAGGWRFADCNILLGT